ncbi:MAG: hypothetical protein WCG95_09300 [bacterium]
MPEQLLQNDCLKHPDKIGTLNFYNLGAETISALTAHNIIKVTSTQLKGRFKSLSETIKNRLTAK